MIIQAVWQVYNVNNQKAQPLWILITHEILEVEFCLLRRDQDEDAIDELENL